jgi:hypothetical protein
MSKHKNPSHITLETNEDLFDMLTASEMGVEQNYHLSDIHKEVAFRKLIEEWIEEEPVREEDGCGHDQNEDYYDE